MRCFVLRASCFVLRASCIVLGVSCLVLGASAENLPRNPFWPQGVEGTRYAITLEPRIKLEPPKVEEPVAVQTDEFGQVQTNEFGEVLQVGGQTNATAKTKKEKLPDPLEDPVWSEAVKALHFGSTMGFSAKGKSQVCIMINGRVYAAGDLVSVNCLENRFTWKIESLSSDGKIKLKRLTYRKIGNNK